MRLPSPRRSRRSSLPTLLDKEHKIVNRPAIEAQLTMIGVIAALLWGIVLGCISAVGVSDIDYIVESYNETNPPRDWMGLKNDCIAGSGPMWKKQLVFSSGLGSLLAAYSLWISVVLYRSLRIKLIGDDDVAAAKVWYKQFSDEISLVERALALSFTFTMFDGIAVISIRTNDCASLYVMGGIFLLYVMALFWTWWRINSQDKGVTKELLAENSSSPGFGNAGSFGSNAGAPAQVVSDQV